MATMNKPRPEADQAGPASESTALNNQPTGHSRRTPSNTALAVRERARTHVARQSARLGALQVKRTASQIAGNARSAGLSPQAVALLESLEAAAADFAAVVRRPETWTEAEQ